MADSKQCQELIEHLDLLLDEELTPELLTDLNRHLAECPGCLDRADVERRFRELVRTRCGSAPTPPDLLARVKALLEATRSEPG